MSIWTLFSSVKTFRSFSLWYGCVCVCKCYSIPYLYSTEQPSGFSSLSLTPQQRGFYLSRESFKNLFSKFLVKLDYTSSSKWSSRLFQGLFKHTFFLKHGTSPVCKPMVHLHSLNTPEFFGLDEFFYWIFLGQWMSCESTDLCVCVVMILYPVVHQRSHRFDLVGTFGCSTWGKLLCFVLFFKSQGFFLVPEVRFKVTFRVTHS